MRYLYPILEIGADRPYRQTKGDSLSNGIEHHSVRFVLRCTKNEN